MQADTDDPRLILGGLGMDTPLSQKTLQDVIHGQILEGKPGAAKRGFAPEIIPVSLSSHWWQGCRGGVCCVCTCLQSPRQGGHAVDFVAVVDQAIALLRQRGRLTYRTLKRQFQLDDHRLGRPDYRTDQRPTARGR